MSSNYIVDISPSWYKVLKEEFESDYFHNIKEFLLGEKAQGKIIYPIGKNIFNAFASTDFDDVKVVVLGQDPYHGKGQAHGLCFSVPDGTKLPPSLKNIFKELHRDVGFEMPASGNLQKWTEQGVLLLNSILTVEAQNPASHSKIGWETFTDKVIQKLSEEREGIVFLLWGSFAKSKRVLINENKHYVLTTTHPSPFSAHKGFLGCGHFSQTNNILIENNLDPIDRSL